MSLFTGLENSRLLARCVNNENRGKRTDRTELIAECPRSCFLFRMKDQHHSRFSNSSSTVSIMHRELHSGTFLRQFRMQRILRSLPRPALLHCGFLPTFFQEKSFEDLHCTDSANLSRFLASIESCENRVPTAVDFILSPFPTAECPSMEDATT